MKKTKTRNKQPLLNSALKRDLLSLFIKIALIAGSVFMLFTFVFGVYYYKDPTMTPAIQDGDLILYYRWDKSYSAQDTIILEYQGERQIRRIVASAGNIVDITEDGLIVDGARQQEPRIYTKTERYDTGIDFPYVVPEDSVFVLADDREDTVDSRVYGSVRIEDTLGKIMGVFRRRGI